MASLQEIQVVVVGSGTNKIGLYLLGFIAKMFSIRLELFSSDRSIAPLCQHGYNGLCPVCDATTQSKV